MSAVKIRCKAFSCTISNASSLQPSPREREQTSGVACDLPSAIARSNGIPFAPYVFRKAAAKSRVSCLSRTRIMVYRLTPWLSFDCSPGCYQPIQYAAFIRRLAGSNRRLLEIKLRLNTVGRTIISIGSGRSHGCAQHSPASPVFERLLIVAISRMFEINGPRSTP